VPYEIGERYVRAGKASGSNVELISLAGTGHSEVVDPTSTQWAAVLEQIERISAMV